MTIHKKYIPAEFKAEQRGNIFLFPVLADQLAAVTKTLYHEHNLPLKLISAQDLSAGGGGFRIFYVFGVPYENVFVVPYLEITGAPQFPSIAVSIHEASLYERKIKTFFGLEPVDHPNPAPFLLHENWPSKQYPLRKDFDGTNRPETAHGEYRFQTVKGEGIYEISVGPVHAGIIEPGHFRFSVAGEEIVLLEPRLGYKHKGIEKLFERLPLADTIRLSERVSGDTSFGHSLAFCQALERLSGVRVTERTRYLRVVFSELERLANHFNDIGFIMQDTGYNFGGSNGARLRETVMQWNEKLTGSRFLRGVNTIGRTQKDIDSLSRDEMLAWLKELQKDFEDIIAVSEESGSLSNRLEGTGVLDLEIAKDHGALGIAGRAVGIKHDARIEYPHAAYDKIPFAIALEESGDVYARLYVRIKEAHTSFEILNQALRAMPKSAEPLSDKKTAFEKNSCAIGITEGWRGEIVYFVHTDAQGKISRVDVRDPSFVNWPLLGYAGKGNVVPDFPLINKSFNLSYSGNDL